MEGDDSEGTSGRDKTIAILVLFHGRVLWHSCLVGHINDIEQQTVFFGWMKRPSDDSFRKIILVQFWEVLHTF